MPLNWKAPRSLMMLAIACWCMGRAPRLALAKTGGAQSIDATAAADKTTTTTPAAKLKSAYVDFSKCKNLFRASPDAPEGSDEPIECAGPGGYVAGEQYSAATTWHMVSHRKAEFQLSLTPEQGQAWSAAPVMEFRLCNGQPFAVIQRVSVCASDDTEACSSGKSLRSVLIVQGLIGFEKLHAEIELPQKRANESARERADQWVTERGCPTPPTPQKPAR